MHDAIGIGQLVRYAIVAADYVRLARQIARKQQTGTDLVLIEEGQQVDPIHIGLRTQGDREVEPGRIRLTLQNEVNMPIQDWPSIIFFACPCIPQNAPAIFAALILIRPQVCVTR